MIENGKVPGTSALPLLSPPTHALEKIICVHSSPNVQGSGKSFTVTAGGSGGGVRPWDEYPIRRTRTGRGRARGVWENRSPGGDINSLNPAQEGGSFISFHHSPQGNSSAWGNTAFIILTPFHCLSNLKGPPGPLHSPPPLRHPCLWGRSHCWKLLGNPVRSSSGPVSEKCTSVYYGESWEERRPCPL